MSKIITISVDVIVEAKFRRVARTKYGKRKGYIGKAVTEAMRRWIASEEEGVRERSLELLEKGIVKDTKKWKFNRDEIYEGRI